MALPQEIPVEFIIRGTEAAELTVEEFANFLRDIVFLHDRLWLIESRTFREYGLEQRPPRLDLENYPHLPPARVRTTQASEYMALLGEVNS